MTSSNEPGAGGNIQARVPEHVSQGLFATGAVILNGPGEFIIDFIQSVIRPARVVKRVVLIPMVMSQFIDAFRENVRLYEQTFGPPKAMPSGPPNPQTRPMTPPPGGAAGGSPAEQPASPPQGQPPSASREESALAEDRPLHERISGPQPPPAMPSVQELYDELKLPDSELSGVYANAVLISHSPAEFVFDFITRFMPRAAVSARIYMSASHAPHVLESMASSFQHHLRNTQPPGK